MASDRLGCQITRPCLATPDPLDLLLWREDPTEKKVLSPLERTIWHATCVVAPRPAGPLYQSLGPVSDSLANLSTPHHRILSVSKLEGEWGSTLTWSGKWRRGGLSVGLGIPAVHWHTPYRLNTELGKRTKWNGLQFQQVDKGKGNLLGRVERRPVTGGALKATMLSETTRSPADASVSLAWNPIVPGHIKPRKQPVPVQTWQHHQHASGQASACRAETRRPGGWSQGGPTASCAACIAPVRWQQQRQHVHRLVIRDRPLCTLRPPPCCLVLLPGNRGRELANCRIRGSVGRGARCPVCKGFATFLSCRWWTPGVACHILPCLFALSLCHVQRTRFSKPFPLPLLPVFPWRRAREKIGDDVCALGGTFAPLNAVAAWVWVMVAGIQRAPWTCWGRQKWERIVGPPSFCPPTQIVSIFPKFCPILHFGTAGHAKKVKSFTRRRRVSVVSLTTLPAATAISCPKSIVFAIGKTHRAKSGPVPPGAETCSCALALLMAEEQSTLRQWTNPLPQPSDVLPPNKASEAPSSCPPPPPPLDSRRWSFRGNLVSGSPTQSHP